MPVAKCLRSGCKNRLPWPRKKYCSNECQRRHLYIDLRLAPRLKKTCLTCQKQFEGTKRHKFCSLDCRYKQQYLNTKASLQRLTAEGHPCKCCEPSKIIPLKEQYCPENKWMTKLTPAERMFGQ